MNSRAVVAASMIYVGVLIALASGLVDATRKFVQKLSGTEAKKAG